MAFGRIADSHSSRRTGSIGEDGECECGGRGCGVVKGGREGGREGGGRGQALF